MPNWCENVLHVQGPRKHIRMFSTVTKPGDTCAFQFGTVIKMPEYLKNNSGWYKWNLKHIGCKWDAVNATLILKKAQQLAYEFDTPWGPPTTGVINISTMFPDLTFRLAYYEPGMVFGGRVTIRNGIVTQDKHKTGTIGTSMYYYNARRNACKKQQSQ